MYWVVFTVALGGVLARDGESCVSQNCWETNSCQKSVKVGAKCSNGAFSGRCGKGIEDSNVDCDKSVGGQPCCVYSRFEGSCECVQRRCHTSKFPDKRVPEECLKERATASTPWFVLRVLKSKRILRWQPSNAYGCIYILKWWPLMLMFPKVGDCGCPGDCGFVGRRHLPLPEKAEPISQTEQQNRRGGGGKAKNQRCWTNLFISGRKMKHVIWCADQSSITCGTVGPAVIDRKGHSSIIKGPNIRSFVAKSVLSRFTRFLVVTAQTKHCQIWQLHD